MIAMDLFADFDQTAREYGWMALGQPERLGRRYGKRIGDAEVTVRVYANGAGTALKGASRRAITEGRPHKFEAHGPRQRGKRDTVLNWLREA